jgi:hypothetical protein
MFTLLDDQQVNAKSNLAAGPIVDKAGNPITVVPPVVWTVDVADVLTLTPAADGNSCMVVTTGKLGPAKLTASVPTADGGTLTEVIDILVSVDPTNALNVTFDTPTDRPIANPVPVPNPNP